MFLFICMMLSKTWHFVKCIWEFQYNVNAKIALFPELLQLQSQPKQVQDLTAQHFCLLQMYITADLQTLWIWYQGVCFFVDADRSYRSLIFHFGATLLQAVVSTSDQSHHVCWRSDKIKMRTQTHTGAVLGFTSCHFCRSGISLLTSITLLLLMG